MIKLLDLITEDIIKDMMKQIGKNTLRYIRAKNFVKGKDRGKQYVEFEVKGSRLGKGGKVRVFSNRGKKLYNIEGWKVKGKKTNKVKDKKRIPVKNLGDTIEDIVG